MDFPHFEVTRLGGGMLVAVVSIIHVVIAHLAVGAGLFLAVGHTRALQRKDELLLDFLKRYSQYLIMIPFVAGAVTGVGIWVTIGLVSPPATSALIHFFVWGWAMEWVFFILEIVAGYVYFYGWGRLTPKRHVAVAWIYFIGAFMSLFLINGIITFMLTPGSWKPPAELGGDVQTAFWKALFNPSFWPSLCLRTISCLAFAGISVAVVANFVRHYTREERQRLINFGSYWLAPFGLMVPFAIWYFATLPEGSRKFAMGGAIAMTLFMAFGLVSSLYIGGYAYFGLIRQKRYINRETALLLFAVAFVATGAMEFVREGVRKPYLIHGYLYSNGIYASQAWRDQVSQEGVVKHAPFAYPASMTLEQVQALPFAHQRGQYVYNAQCRSCHEPEGTNDIAPLINRASRELVTQMTTELNYLKGYMPPFVGTKQELSDLVEYELFLANPNTYVPRTN